MPVAIPHRITLVALLVLPATFGLLGPPAAARAAGLESLLMPGKVSRAHERQEEQCALCHDRADKGRQATLCLDCHEDIAADLRAARGMHGRLAGIAGAQCSACHTEHLGRDGDIVKSTAVALDHRATDFPLEGAHQVLVCSACHKPGRKARATGSACVDCHRGDDVHRGQLDPDCGSCHGQRSWAGGRFDHNRTNFRLADGHALVSCNACHAGGRYEGTPTRCVACHRPDDTHAGARGENCDSCHTSAEWQTSRFDHGRQADFPLAGRHAHLNCGACHTGGRLEDPVPRDCVGCHRADDMHAVRFGTGCGDCHGQDQWQVPAWDHTARTGVVLPDGHTKLACHACHTDTVARQPVRQTCAACHRPEDPHGGALGVACNDCHATSGWRDDIRFDHDLTDYPLLGLHVLPTCAQCHTSKAFRGAPQDCHACHSRDDVHKGSLGKDCSACHSPNGWKLWEFDHARKARFELAGAHARVACVACHRQPAGVVELPRDCASCHRSDDIHLGQFGPQCQHCHSTLGFQGARIQ